MIYNGAGTWDIMAQPDFPYDIFVSKTLTAEPRIGNPNNWRPWGSGMRNNVQLHNPGLYTFATEMLSAIKVPVVVSVYAPSPTNVPSLMAGVERCLEVKPIEAVEVNLSCPTVGQTISNERAKEIVRRVVAATERAGDVDDLPVYAKVSPTDTNRFVYELVEAGASKLVVANSLPTPVGGLSGRPIQSLVLELIEDIRRMDDKTPIIGCGGIEGPEDLLSMRRFEEVGANDFAIGSYNLSSGV